MISAPARAARPASAFAPDSPWAGGSGTSIPARRISRPSSRMKLRPSVIARIFAVATVSNRQALSVALSARAGADGRMVAMHDTQQNRARATSQRPPMRQQNRRNGAALRRCVRAALMWDTSRWSYGAQSLYILPTDKWGRGELMKIVAIVQRARPRHYG